MRLFVTVSITLSVSVVVPATSSVRVCVRGPGRNHTFECVTVCVVVRSTRLCPRMTMSVPMSVSMCVSVFVTMSVSVVVPVFMAMSVRVRFRF